MDGKGKCTLHNIHIYLDKQNETQFFCSSCTIQKAYMKKIKFCMNFSNLLLSQLTCNT